MIKFIEKRHEESDLTKEAIEHLKLDGQTPNIIDEKDADKVSKINSKSLVLYKFVLNTNSRYEIQVMDKELYNFTVKLLSEKLGLTVTNIDEESRLITAENKYKGAMLNAIDILGRRYNLSIVVRK